MSQNQKICFVISPIGDEDSSTRARSDFVLQNIIVPATAECGYEAIRADDISTPGIITDQIIRHLIEDPLVIADLTEANPNVFYELAIRHVLKKPVVQITEEDRIPFDVAQTRTIFFDHNTVQKCEECKTKIIEQIRAVERDPSLVDAPISIPHLPFTQTFRTEAEINEYMLNLISLGSTLDIVSERLHWISENNDIKSRIIDRANHGVDINIYLPQSNPISDELQKKNIAIHICPSLCNSPHARFTLINKNRLGASRLAIGVGSTPQFIISEFDESTNAQIIAMARDYTTFLESTSQ